MNRLHLKKTELNRKVTGRKIISVMSGKGGVGKSVITCNLACTLARMGQRVLLVDADVNFGSQHVLANVVVEYGIKEVFNRQLSVNEASFRINENLSLLAAVNSVGLFEEPDITVIAGFMHTLREQSDRFDIILIDYPSGLSKASSVLAYASDMVISVLVPELTSISDGYGLFKYLHDVNPSIDCRLLVNRAEDSDEAEYIYSKLCAIAERFVERIPKYFGYVTEDESVRKAVASQISVAEQSADSNVVKQFKALSHKILSQQVRPEINHREKSKTEIINKPAAVADIKE